MTHLVVFMVAVSGFIFTSPTVNATERRDISTAVERIFKSRLDELRGNALCRMLCNCNVELRSATARDTRERKFPFEAEIKATANDVDLSLIVRAEYSKLCKIKILSGTRVIDNSRYNGLLKPCSKLLDETKAVARLRADFTEGKEHKVEEADCKAANAEFRN